MNLRPMPSVLCVLALSVAAARGQFDMPAQPAPKEEPDFRIIEPKVDEKTRTVSIPAAFWNQRMTSWVEVALCGRPSDFLHETIASITTTKSRMTAALRKAGFRDADFWVDNVSDFPRVRGDRAMILLEVELGGKKEIFPLDELLAYQGWGVSIGPFGWMYKGDPGADKAGNKPAKPEGDKPQEKLSPRQEILADDPQVALQFKGIQHLSQSYMDHPLAYDQWIYPPVRYQRNYSITPRTLAVPKTTTTQPDGKSQDDDAATALGKFWAKLYESNGDVPVTLTVQKVSEAQFLEAMARHWHDPKMAGHIRDQLPAAREIDGAKGELETLVPELRKMIATGKPREDIAESETFARIALATARAEKGYAALDAAWAVWSTDHPVYEAPNNEALAALKEQAKLWREHLVDWKDRAAWLHTAEDARFQMRDLRKKTDEASKTRVRALTGTELEARSQAMLLETRHPLAYWKYEEDRLTPDETRVDWVRNIKTQLELARAKKEVGQSGVELGKLLQAGGADTPIPKAQERQKTAVLRMTLADLGAQLADAEFEVSKREAIEGDPDLPRYKARRDALRARIEEIQATTRPK